MPFEEKEYDVQKAIARHEGLPFLYKRAEITSQPIANPVPLAETSGYTAGGDDIETTLNNAPSAIGTGKSSNIDDLDDGAMAISIEGDPEMIDNDFIEDIEDVLQGGSIEDIFEHIVKQLGEIVNESEDHEKTKKDSAAHKVEKDGEKFYVVEDGNEKAAGPFDSQEDAYARANELNDLENLEKEASGGFLGDAAQNLIGTGADAIGQVADFAEGVAGKQIDATPEGEISGFFGESGKDIAKDTFNETSIGKMLSEAEKLNDPKESSVTPAMAKARRLIASKNCQCWEGYKRVPGTKPCAPGSCEKCDSHSKKEAFKIADTQDQISKFILELNENYRQLCESMGVIKPQNAGILPDGRIAQPTPDLQRGGVRTAPAILIDSSFDPGQRPNLIANGIDPANLGLQPLTDQELETFQMSEANRQYAQSLPNSLTQLGYNTKVGSQGDKPSPNAAQAVLASLVSGNEEEAKELLKMTDCPEGCETHPEGKCNHGYMSAGRTRVRYLINDSSFDKSEEPVEIQK